MPDWLSYPRAGYVLAAYAVAAVLLLGLLAASLLALRRRQREWAQSQSLNANR